jgi:CzcA family heavy metal efflux pump
MRWVVGSSLRFRFLVIAAAGALLFFGIGKVRDARVDVFPEFAPPQVQIQTACLGLSAEEVEEFVSVPLEQALNGVPGLDVIRSESVSQLSAISLVFDRGVSLRRARQLTQERLSTISPNLPTWAAPPVLMPPVSATARVMKIGLSPASKDMTLIKMSTVAYWNIRQRLLRVPGVANVAIWGERLQQEHVLADPKRMAEHDVSLDQLMNATADSLEAGLLKFSEGAVIGTGGVLDTPNQRLSVRNILPIRTPQDLAQVTIKRQGGAGVELSDVADVREAHQPLFGDAIVNDKPGLLLVVEKFQGANTLDVTRGIDEALADLKPGLSGIDVDAKIFRPAEFIELAIDNLTRALLLGTALVVLVLIMFLFEWRAALISLVSIPLSLLAAVLVLYARGDTINTMILAGLVIAVGVVVDDAIIDVENMVRRLRQLVRRLRQRRGEGQRFAVMHVVLEASLEVRRPIVYATLINVIAVVPVFFLESVSGSFFQPLALSYAIAVAASMVVALTVTPALGLILLSRAPLERGESPIVRSLKRAYRAGLARVVRSPAPAYGIVAVTLLAGLLVLPQLGQNLFPAFKERDFLMHWVSAPGTSQPESARITTQGSRELRQIPGVRNFGSHIGQALQGEEIVGVNFSENWISVDPKADYDKTLARIEEVVEGYPGLFRNVETYLRERIDEVIVGESAPIIVRVFGDDLKVLRSKAHEVRDHMAEIEGIDDLHVELSKDIPQIDVQVKLHVAERYGLKPGDVRRAAATLMASEEVGDIFREGKAYDVHVWSTPETRQDLDDVRALPIDTVDGGTVPLGQVADVRIKPTPNDIKRENVSRRIDVIAEPHDRSLSAVVDDVQDRVEEVKFPIGYHAEVLGEGAEAQAAGHRLRMFGLAAAIAIFLLLVAAFRSVRLALLLFVTLPMALVGGVLAAYVGGGIVELGSLVGFLTVLGIAARNGILMINHCQHLEAVEGEPFGPELVLRGAEERLSPIMMTALATGLALVPLIVLGTIPGHEIEHPMAVVIVGGLITSTLLNLFVVPSLYLRFGRDARHRGVATPGPRDAAG